MMKSGKFLFWLWCCLILKISLCESLVMRYNKDTYLQDNSFYNNTAYSVYLCISICYRFHYCKSVNFVKSIKLCMLNSVDSKTVQTISMIGSYYMEKEEFPNELYPTECHCKICEDNYFCVNSEWCSMWTANVLTPTVVHKETTLVQDHATDAKNTENKTTVVFVTSAKFYLAHSTITESTFIPTSADSPLAESTEHKSAYKSALTESTMTASTSSDTANSSLAKGTVTFTSSIATSSIGKSIVTDTTTLGTPAESSSALSTMTEIFMASDKSSLTASIVTETTSARTSPLPDTKSLMTESSLTGSTSTRTSATLPDSTVAETTSTPTSARLTDSTVVETTFTQTSTRLTDGTTAETTTTQTSVNIDCGPPSADTTATIIYANTKLGSTAIYKCNRAPESGSGEVTTIYCQMSGLWSSANISCPRTCLSPSNIRSQQEVSYYYNYSNIYAHYFCNSYPDASPSVSCPVSKCTEPESWGSASLSCSVKDCYVMTLPDSYYGKVSCTVSGRTCKVWSANTPSVSAYLPILFTELNTNYCRAIGFYNRPWCYTTDPLVRWEYCAVGQC